MTESYGYEDVPPQVRELRQEKQRLRAEWSRIRAENLGAEDLTGLVLLLRDRSRKANVRARVFLILLVFSTVFSLVVYVGFPFARDYLHGASQSLEEQREMLIDAANNTRISL